MYYKASYTISQHYATASNDTMLLDFTVGNFGPFRDDTTLNMNATKITEHKENIIGSETIDKDILSSAIVFGPNAAGKSFITDALLILKEVVRIVDNDIPQALYIPYRLSKECRDAPTRLGIRLVLDGVLYDYRIEYRAGVVTSESLHHYPKGRPSRVFVRNGPDDYTGAKKRVVSMTKPGKTYLAMAAVGADPVCTKVRNAIIDDIVILSGDPRIYAGSTCKACDDPRRKAMTVKALGTADLGICDFSYEEEQMDLVDYQRKMPPELYDAMKSKSDTMSRIDIRLIHDFPSPEIDEEGRTIPMEAESEGTKSIFGLMAPLIDVLENGKTLIIDELGSHLHPMLTRWIVKQFSRENNPCGAQLVANTHDLGLMDIDGLLRRDQIWFVNRSRENGVSELYCLSDFDGVRKDTDVLRRYLDGRFDAVPAVKHRGVIG